MSTFPGRVKLKPQPSKFNGTTITSTIGEPAEPLLTRPTSESRFNLDRQLEFDAGLNSSAAWTEHIIGHDHVAKLGATAGDDLSSLSLSLSDEGSDKTTIPSVTNLTEEQQETNEGIFAPGRPARVLYDFTGEPDSQELVCLSAGEEIEVLQERIEGAEGWSLARVPVRVNQTEEQNEDKEEDKEENGGEVGLVPREYYAFTTNFLASPSEEQQLATTQTPPSSSHVREASTPRPSTLTNPTITSNGTVKAKVKEKTDLNVTVNPAPIVSPQNTGEWFKQQMRSLILGGRSLNRFSRFVTSGAEAFILRGPVTVTRGEPSVHMATSASKVTSYSGAKGEVDVTTENDGLPSTHPTRLSTYLSPPLLSAPVSAHTREPTLPTESLPDTHYIDVDEAGPTWREKVPSFEVRVHSPEKRYPDPVGLGSGGGAGAGGGEAGAYIVYSVTSIFSPPSRSSSPSISDVDDSSSSLPSPPLPPPSFTHTLTVPRRFTHFLLLHRTLSSLLPALALPPLPPKQFSGRLNAEFVEARRRELERWLRLVVSHPVVRYVEPVRFFLGCEDEVEFRRQLPTILHSSSSSLSSTELGRTFFSNVYHPPFQVDLEDATATLTRFKNHVRAVSRRVQHFRLGSGSGSGLGVGASRGLGGGGGTTFGEVRRARVEMSRAERMLSFEILGLITGREVGRGGEDEEDEEAEDKEEANGEGQEGSGKPQSPTRSIGRSRKSYGRKEGVQNSEGAWCWREECPDCLRLTKCMQKTAETLQGVADLYDSHARRTMFETEDSLKDVAHPDVIYAPILDIHKQTLERYKEASSHPGNKPLSDCTSSSHNINGANGIASTKVEEGKEDSEDTITTRCETVLNTTLAEIDAYHAQKVEGFERIVTTHLDGEIAFYEKVLARLRTTRALFDASPTELELTMPGPRQPSIYERDFPLSPFSPHSSSYTSVASEALLTPAPHVLDSKSPGSMVTRPVSDAIHGLLGFAGVAGVNGVNGSGVNDRGEGGGDGRVAEEDGRGSMFSRLW